MLPFIVLRSSMEETRLKELQLKAAMLNNKCSLVLQLASLLSEAMSLIAQYNKELADQESRHDNRG